MGLRALLGLKRLPERKHGRGNSASDPTVGSNYVFVVGCGHTGTSIVTAMLGAHPRIYAIPHETGAFLRDRRTADARRIIDNDASVCDKRPVAYICEKTPKHVHCADKILDAYPEARFVVTTRDPLDVIASLKRRTGSLESSIDRWRTDHKAAAALAVRSNAFLLHYEHLIAAPQRILTGLCQWLTLPFDPSMLDFWKDGREWFGAREQCDTDGANGIKHDVRRNWQIHQPLMTDRVGVWRRDLTPEEFETISRELKVLESTMPQSLQAYFRGRVRQPF